MKSIIFSLLLIPALLFGQDIPKKATQIFIHNDKTQGENFILISKFLLDEAIEIKSRDKELGVISSDVFKRGKGHPVALTFFCQDSIVRITGKFKMGMELNFGSVTATDDFEQIINKGMKGSIYEKSFRSMNDIALLLGNQLTYK